MRKEDLMESRSSAREDGYSLLEQISIIAIASILITVSVPSYRYVTHSSRASAEINGLLADMQFARSQAITAGQPVTVCASSDSQTCAANSRDWQTGWIVFSDPDASGTVVSTTSILRAQPGFAATRDLLLAPPGISSVTFNREGFTTKLPVAVNGAVTFTLHTQPSNSQWTRCLQVSVAGMITTERARQAGCQ